MIKVSVIIPIYNDELYLRDALRSIQQQSLTEFECICVNDGSKDKSELIIDEFISLDSRFIKVNRPNGGVSAARNTGLQLAQGEFVYMMDHDDLTPPYSLEKLYNSAVELNTDLVRGRMMMIAEDFRIDQLPSSSVSTQVKRYNNPLTDYYRHVRGKNKKWYYIWMCLFRRKILDNVRFVDDLRSGGEDFLFTFDVVANISSFVQISDVVACHRHSKISVTLNGYKPRLFFDISKIVVPYIYNTYALNKSIDRRLLRWVYHKEAYAVYRFLIRNIIKLNKTEFQNEATDILQSMQGKPEFLFIEKYWNLRQRFFCKLMLNKKYTLASKLKIFM